MSDNFKYNPLTSDMDLVGDGRGGGEVPAVQSEVTYAQLVALRNSGKLAPGTWYRIIDYQCTTTQVNTQSAGHLFDVIVRADSNDTINENAFAAHHGRTGYFENSKLAAWRLKYCLDNDTDRFAWADSANGKGVIYFMQDEFGNECPYDFKNIMFRRWQVTAFDEDPDLVMDVYYLGAYDLSGQIKTLENSTYGQGTWYYTFSNNLGEDNSLGFAINNNKILAYFSNSRRFLNNNVFIAYHGRACASNSLMHGCINNTFGRVIDGNILKIDCDGNTFMGCINIEIGAHCFKNVIHGNYHNIGDDCYNNVIADNCESVTMADGCYGNKIAQHCNGVRFYHRCYKNKIGSYGHGVILYYNCHDNTLGNNCRRVEFSDDCSNNTLGNYCVSLKFGDSCKYNEFERNCRFVNIHDYVTYCIIRGGTSTSGNVQNAIILSGTKGDNNDKLVISFAQVKTYTQVAGLDSNGDLRIWIPADLARNSSQAEAVAIPGTNNEFNLEL